VCSPSLFATIPFKVPTTSISFWRFLLLLLLLFFFFFFFFFFRLFSVYLLLCFGLLLNLQLRRQRYAVDRTDVFVPEIPLVDYDDTDDTDTEDAAMHGKGKHEALCDSTNAEETSKVTRASPAKRRRIVCAAGSPAPPRGSARGSMKRNAPLLGSRGECEEVLALQRRADAVSSRKQSLQAAAALL